MRGDSGRYGLWPMGYGYGLWAMGYGLWVDMQNGTWAQFIIQNTRGAVGARRVTGYGAQSALGGRVIAAGWRAGVTGYRATGYGWLAGVLALVGLHNQIYANRPGPA